MRKLFIITLLAMLYGCSSGVRTSSNKDSTINSDQEDELIRSTPTGKYLYMDVTGCVHTTLHCSVLRKLVGGVIYIPIDKLESTKIEDQSWELQTQYLKGVGNIYVDYPFYCWRCVDEKTYEDIDKESS